MTTDETMDALIDARKAWDAWQEAWADLKRTMRAADLSTVRIEAYQAGTGYDEGGGQSMEGWLDEIEQQIDQAYADQAESRL